MHPALQTVLDAAAKPARSVPGPGQTRRSATYANQLDERLQGLTPREQVNLLSNQFLHWTAMYERFCKQAANGSLVIPPGDDPPTATDYVLTISEIDLRLARARRNTGCGNE